MDKRVGGMLKYTAKQGTFYLSMTILMLLGIWVVLPNLFSLVTGNGLSINITDLQSLSSTYMIVFAVMPAIYFEQQFKLSLQNGFSRPQFFKITVYSTIGLVALSLVLHLIYTSLLGGDRFYNIYNGYFTNPIVNGICRLIMLVLLISLLMWGGQLLGAFLNLFPKKIRKWIGVAFFMIWLPIGSILGVIGVGIYQLIHNNIISANAVLDFGKSVLKILFGFAAQTPYNPLNLIGTLIIVNAIIIYLTRFIILRLQLHRG